MKIGLQTWGTEGDMSHFTALAAGLVRAGHEVVLAMSNISAGNYRPLARRDGYALVEAPQPPPSARPAGDEDIWPKIMMVRNPIRRGELILQHGFDPYVEGMFSLAKDLCARCDLVVCFYMVFPLRVAAELSGTPLVTLHPGHNCMPSAWVGSSELPDLGRWSYRLGWSLVRYLNNRRYLARVNRLRSRVGLRPETDVMTQTWVSPLLNLIAVSPAICKPAPDWGPHHHVCGFLNPLPNPVAEPLPEGLADFIAAGTPPVYFTFGSAIADNDAAYIANVVAIWRAAVERVGCRAIFQLPSNDLGQFDAGPRAFKVRRAPYARVFPTCALVVHHGGAGTTQTALLAGRPSVVVAHMADQFFWGSELRRLGVAGRLLKRTGMTPKRLAKAIAAVLDQPAMARRAAVLRDAMVAEDGVRSAVARIEEIAQRLVTRGGVCS